MCTNAVHFNLPMYYGSRCVESVVMCSREMACFSHLRVTGTPTPPLVSQSVCLADKCSAAKQHPDSIECMCNCEEALQCRAVKAAKMS